MRRAVVTGGAGFIGSYIVDELIKRRINVCIIDNLRSGLKINFKHHKNNKLMKFYREDINDFNTIEQIFYDFKPDAIFHLAAIPGVPFSVENPNESNNTNVTGTLNVLEAARRCEAKRVIFSSSSSVYGGSNILPTPESILVNPKSPYALQKYIGEEYCKMYSKIYGLDTAILRYFNVFGSRQRSDSPYSAVIAAFCNAKLNNTTSVIYGDGEQSRDFSHVDNVVNANLLAATYSSPVNGGIFNVGCGGRITLNNLYSELNLSKVKYMPEGRPGDVKDSQADISKISNILKYEVITPFKEGLQKTMEEYTKINKKRIIRR